ncbi:MAG TPA: murein transglycosylase [Rhodospirillaceae bacterium]|nr:murein transglycosylase [Rhodospirillaceae bacterium]
MKAAAACCAVLLLAGCAVVPTEEKPKLVRASFNDMAGWQRDAALEALLAFQKSCMALQKKSPDATFVQKEAGRAQDWQNVCANMQERAIATDDEARLFFEEHFTPYRFDGTEKGLFTGYYEAQLRGARQRGGPYQTPLYTRPEDMLTADLGLFKDSLKGQKITGKVQDRSFVPYDDRAAIAAGSLDKRATPLLWVDDPVDAFFLEIQGSGQVVMDGEDAIRVVYDAQNGRGYTPIGRVLAAQGEIEKPVTMQKIRTWLAQNPARAQEIMNQNPSVVFFRQSKRDGAVGAQGVVLTPMRSLAVDPAFVPLGTPVWLASDKHHRLVVAQDTGGAIKGAVRGDLFWGAGREAEAGAGEMQEGGTYYVLLPKSVRRP